MRHYYYENFCLPLTFDDLFIRTRQQRLSPETLLTGLLAGVVGGTTYLLQRFD
jgi:hypothetical protein